MANSIDIGAIALGAALGYGLRKEIRSTGNVCRNALLAAVAGAAATAAAKSPEEKAADWLNRMDQQIQSNGNSNGQNQEVVMTIKYTITPDEMEYLIRMLIDILEKNRVHLD